MGEQEELDSSFLELQLSEVEMLHSMYPKDGEFELDDHLVIADVKDYIDGKVVDVPPRISFAVKVSPESDASAGKEDFEIVCSLPHQYPHTEPEIFVRHNFFSRQQQKQINDDLNDFISSLERGDICITEAIQWVQDNGSKYISPTETLVSSQADGYAKPDIKHTTLTRLWIHSHHIRSKFKRRDLLDMAADMQLTGFCLPGKPGIICIEGYKEICEEFWHRVRRWTWKKISCKHREDTPIESDDGSKTLKDFRFFQTFEEIAFDAHAFHGRDYHMDLGKFYQYLNEHKCGYIFKILLGVDGKIPSP
ncbi:RWD domain-containing protein 2A-like [Glandiceps talaboti]